MKKIYLLLLPVIAMVLCGCPRKVVDKFTYFPVWSEDAEFLLFYQTGHKIDTIHMQTKDSCLIVYEKTKWGHTSDDITIEIQRIKGDKPIYILPESKHPNYLTYEETERNYYQVSTQRWLMEEGGYYEIIGGTEANFMYNYVQKLLETNPQSLIIIDDNEPHKIIAKDPMIYAPC